MLRTCLHGWQEFAQIYPIIPCQAIGHLTIDRANQSALIIRNRLKIQCRAVIGRQRNVLAGAADLINAIHQALIGQLRPDCAPLDIHVILIRDRMLAPGRSHIQAAGPGGQIIPALHCAKGSGRRLDFSFSIQCGICKIDCRCIFPCLIQQGRAVIKQAAKTTGRSRIRIGKFRSCFIGLGASRIDNRIHDVQHGVFIYIAMQFGTAAIYKSRLTGIGLQT